MQLVIPSHPIPPNDNHPGPLLLCCSHHFPGNFLPSLLSYYNKYTNPKVRTLTLVAVLYIVSTQGLYLGVVAIDGGGLTELVDNKTTEVGKWFQGHVVVYAIICPLLHSP